MRWEQGRESPENPHMRSAFVYRRRLEERGTQENLRGRAVQQWIWACNSASNRTAPKIVHGLAWVYLSKETPSIRSKTMPRRHSSHHLVAEDVVVPGRAEGEGSSVRACGRTSKRRWPTELTAYTLAPSPAAAPSLALILLKLQDSMAERWKAHSGGVGVECVGLSTAGFRTSARCGLRLARACRCGRSAERFDTNSLRCSGPERATFSSSGLCPSRSGEACAGTHSLTGFISAVVQSSFKIVPMLDSWRTGHCR